MDVEEEPSDLEKPIEMVVFDDQSHIYYGGTCQVFLNVDTNTLLVKPVNKELQIFSTSFESYFITEQNIIYVESSLECIKFALIFPEPIFAQNLYKIVVTHRPTYNIIRHLLKEKLLLGLIKISDLPKANEILTKFINFCDEEKKLEYLNLVKAQRDQYILVNPESNQNSVGNELENSSQNCAFNKRKVLNDPSKENNEKIQHEKSRSKNKQYNIKQMVQPKNYKIVKYQKDNQVQQKLFIFNAQDRNFAHAFKWNDRKMLFECLRCQDKTMTKIVTAAIKTDNFGEEFIYLNTDTHSCRVQRYEEVENVF